MKRFLITTVTAISIATKSISASAIPARAGGFDIAEVLGALALFRSSPPGSSTKESLKRKSNTPQNRVLSANRLLFQGAVFAALRVIRAHDVLWRGDAWNVIIQQQDHCPIIARHGSKMRAATRARGMICAAYGRMATALSVKPTKVFGPSVIGSGPGRPFLVKEDYENIPHIRS